MPITLNGDGTVGGVTDFTDVDGGDFVATSVETTGNLLVHEVSANRYTLRVDETNNTVGINTSSAPAAGTFLQIADATDPIVSLDNTGNGEVRLGCGSAEGYIGTESSTPFVLTTGGNTRVHIAANGNIGINNNTPDETVVIGGSVGQIKAKGSGAEIEFTRAGRSFITASDAAGSLGFQAGGINEIVTVASNGNVGIGTTSPICPLQVVTGEALVNNGNPRNVLFLQTGEGITDDEGPAIAFGQSQSLSYAQIGARKETGKQYGGYLQFITNTNAGSMLERLRITSDGVILLPEGSPGIQFGDVSPNATSSLLDDYEEGTFTPLFRSDGTTTKLTGLNNEVGTYTKIGNVVHFNITFNGVGTGNFAVGDLISVLGLPFVANRGGSVTAIGQKASQPTKGDMVMETPYVTGDIGVFGQVTEVRGVGVPVNDSLMVLRGSYSVA